MTSITSSRYQYGRLSWPHVMCRPPRWSRGCGTVGPCGTAGELAGVVHRDDLDDLAEPEGHDGQVVATQPQRRCAEQDTGDETRQDRERDRHQRGHVQPARRFAGQRADQVGGRVRADLVERDVTEVEQPGPADDDVEPDREQDVDADLTDQHVLPRHRQRRRVEQRQRDADDDQSAGRSTTSCARFTADCTGRSPLRGNASTGSGLP